LTTAEFANRLGVSPRQARRYATKLDGQRVAGRWLIPTSAVAEHLEGKL